MACWSSISLTGPYGALARIVLGCIEPHDQEARSSDREVLGGPVERVTFHNAENGFCVLRLKARGHRELVTVVGHAAAISAGEWLTASAEWVNDRTHGQQFRARFLKTGEPTSVEGIERYLGSGMIRGIGPVYARKLVRAFGDKVFNVIEAEPNRLREVDGIGPVRAGRVAAGINRVGALVEIFANPKSNTWTVVVIKSTGLSCMVDAGQEWSVYPVQSDTY